MSKKQKGRIWTFAILGVLLALILAVVLSSPLLRPPAGPTPLEIGFTALDGRRLLTSDGDFRGKVVLVDLMAANCPPCNAEMPELLAFRESVRGLDVELISLSIWVGQGLGEDVEDLQAFRTFWGSDWTFGVPDDTLSLVVEYQVQFPPFKLLLDRDGQLVWTRPGETSSDVLLAAVNEAL
ncbi:MAG: TlpA family protein disulfide reductase [Thermoplasmata archaeon]